MKRCSTLIVASALIASTNSLHAQESRIWLGAFGGCAWNNYSSSTSTEAWMSGLDKQIGFRFEPELSGRTRLSLSLEWHERSAISESFLPLAQGRYLLSSTRVDIRSLAVGVGFNREVIHSGKWNARLLLGGAISGPRSVDLFVTTPFGTSSFFQDNESRDIGFVIRAGGRFARSLTSGINLFAEAMASIIVKDEYEWHHHNGLSVQPITPKRWGALLFSIGVEFGMPVESRPR